MANLNNDDSQQQPILRNPCRRYIVPPPFGEMGSVSYDLFKEWEANHFGTQYSPSPSNGTTRGNTSTHVSQTQETMEASQRSIDGLLMRENREQLPFLDPKRIDNSTWFKYDKQITKSILGMIKTLPTAFPRYSALPIETKNQWFTTFAVSIRNSMNYTCLTYIFCLITLSFQQEYNWHPTSTISVRKVFDSVASTTFKNHVFLWKKKFIKGEDKPPWMKESVWQGYVSMWGEDSYKKLCEKNSKNRKSDRGGDGPAAHTTGAKSYERCYEEMMQSKGQPPNMLEFIDDKHRSKKTKVILDKKVERIIEKVKSKEQEILSQHSQEDTVESHMLSNNEINALVLEEVDVVRGQPYGLGSLNVFGGSSSSNSYVPKLKEELEAAKIKITDMQKAQEVQDKKLEAQGKEIELLKTMLQQHFSRAD